MLCFRFDVFFFSPTPGRHHKKNTGEWGREDKLISMFISEIISTPWEKQKINKRIFSLKVKQCLWKLIYEHENWVWGFALNLLWNMNNSVNLCEWNFILYFLKRLRIFKGKNQVSLFRKKIFSENMFWVLNFSFVEI